MKKIFLTFTLLFAFNITTTIPSENNPYTIKIFTKEDIKPLIPFIAQLRMNTFRDYPYLYDGDKNYELKSIKEYAHCPNSALAVAYYNDLPIGFLRGINFVHYATNNEFENDIIQEFKNEGLNPEKHYYFADIIILPEHRGKQLSPKLFTILEDHAQQCGYESVCFITEHHHNHPLKPENHRSLIPLWNNLGYTKSSILGYDTWQTHQGDGTIKPERHPLAFWFKNLTK